MTPFIKIVSGMRIKCNLFLFAYCSFEKLYIKISPFHLFVKSFGLSQRKFIYAPSTAIRHRQTPRGYPREELFYAAAKKPQGFPGGGQTNLIPLSSKVIFPGLLADDRGDAYPNRPHRETGTVALRTG